jgi:hypothetical protein
MHRSHPFLTGSDDYPLAALLVLDGRPLPERLADVEAIYSLLHLKGLSRGNGLQLAALILALGPGTPMERAERAVDLRDRLRASGIRLWPQYYGALGMLGLLPDPDGRRAGEAVEVVAAFRRLRHYRWLDKGLLLLFASILLADEAMRDPASTTAGVLLEVLIQAQAAAMVAVTAATTSAAASAGS